MIEDFFNKKPSIVLMGSMVENAAVVEKAHTLCSHVFYAKTPDELLNIVYLHYPNIIFGTVAYETTYYIDALSWIKKLKMNTYVTLYFEEKHLFLFEGDYGF